MKKTLTSFACALLVGIYSCGGPESPNQQETEAATGAKSIGKPSGNADHSGDAAEGGIDSTSLETNKAKNAERSY